MDLWSVEAFEKILDHEGGRSLSLKKNSVVTKKAFRTGTIDLYIFFSKGVYFLKYPPSL